MEPPFDKLDGVISTTSGYMGGEKATANYKAVSKGNTKHREVLEVRYDSTKVSFEKLAEVFWGNIDPFDSKGQFCDKGYQYTSALYYETTQEKELALKSLSDAKKMLKEQGEVVTPIEKQNTFYSAEDYHQDYYKKNPLRYKFYRFNCGRDKRLRAVWGKGKS